MNVTTGTTSTTSASGHWRIFVGYTGPRAPGANDIRDRIRADLPDIEILGCKAGDPPDKIRREFRRLAKIHHPDVGGDPAEFRRIRSAYARLKRQGLA